MYIVKLRDNTILHNLRFGYALLSGEVTTELNTTNSFTFDIDIAHSNYDKVKIMDKDNFIEVYEDERLLFLGRILNIEGDKEKKVTSEGVLGILNDFIISISKNITATDLMKLIVTTANSAFKVSGFDFSFEIGKITVEGTIEIEKQTTKTAYAWLTEIVNEQGGYFYADYLNVGAKINLVSSFADTCTQPVKTGLNIISQSVIDSGDRIATAIVPSTTFKSGDIEKTISITSIPEGSWNITDDGKLQYNADINYGEYAHLKNSNYIYSNSAIKRHGIIQEEFALTQEISSDELLKKAILQLQADSFHECSYSFKILDLHKVNKNIEPFEVGKYVKISDYNIAILCTKTVTDITNPSADSIQLGATLKYITQY